MRLVLASVEPIEFNGFWLLVQHQYWTVNEIPLGYPAIDKSNGDPMAMVPWDQSLHELQQVMDRTDSKFEEQILEQPEYRIIVIFLKHSYLPMCL
ncbi:hypothetical protein STEG23_037646, partial [Scotinomys teguina]